MMRFVVSVFLVASLGQSARGATLRSAKHSQDPLDTPSQIGYDPFDLLCTLGKKKQGWCVDWMQCIKANAAGQASKVKEAWDPADCEEYCGVHPVTTPREGTAFLQRVNSSSTLTRLFGQRAGASTKDCMSSCSNFQESLVDCVGTIMYEPGKLAVMGGDKKADSEGPALCSAKDTHCMPELPIKYQKCHSKRTHAKLDGKKFDDAECEMIESDYEDCKDCPQLKDNYGSQYTAFVGGCIDQLNAYWQATHPSAGVHALPGAKGCQVHD